MMRYEALLVRLCKGLGCLLVLRVNRLGQCSAVLLRHHMLACQGGWYAGR